MTLIQQTIGVINNAYSKAVRKCHDHNRITVYYLYTQIVLHKHVKIRVCDDLDLQRVYKFVVNFAEHVEIEY